MVATKRIEALSSQEAAWLREGVTDISEISYRRGFIST